MFDKDKLWKSVLGELELQIPKLTFSTFFLKTKIIEADLEIIKIACPNSASISKLSKDYREDIEEIIKKRINTLPVLEFSINNTLTLSGVSNTINKESLNTANTNNLFSKINQNTSTPKLRSNFKSGLNSAQTFDTYIVGPNNQLAHSVAKTIAESRQALYNPFLVYSKVGLGKTHLLNAIGNSLQKQHQGYKVYYTSGEEFMNELIDSITTGSRSENVLFRNKYRNIDALLIDDVHQIAGKESTQEAFFNIFNHLYKNKKQIVVSTDKHPREIKKLEERISSRFKMGMIVDIQKPDIEVRIAILKTKAKELGLENIDRDIIYFISENVDTNIRELEGSFLQVITHAKALNEKLDVELCKRVLSQNLILKEEKNIKPSTVIQNVAKYYDYDIRTIKGKTRKKDISLARQVTMFLLKEINQLPLKSIGEFLGGRDHTTIMHGIGKIKNETANNNYRLKREINDIKDMIFNSR